MSKINYNRLLFFDFETTGFKENAPVSIGFYLFENGKKEYSRYVIINPETKIEEGAIKVHGLTQEWVNDFKPFPYFWEEYKQYFDNSILIGWNVRYDYERCLLKALARYDLPMPENVYVCDAMENAKIYIPKTEVKNYKLDTICEYFNISSDDHHNSMADTKMCYRIYNKLVKLSKGKLVVRDKNYNIVEEDEDGD